MSLFLILELEIPDIQDEDDQHEAGSQHEDAEGDQQAAAPAEEPQAVASPSQHEEEPKSGRKGKNFNTNKGLKLIIAKVYDTKKGLKLIVTQVSPKNA